MDETSGQPDEERFEDAIRSPLPATFIEQLQITEMSIKPQDKAQEETNGVDESVAQEPAQPPTTQMITEVSMSQQDPKETSTTQENVSSSETPSVPPPPSALFKNVRYYVINSQDAQIESLLDSNGAQKEPYLSTFVTHVVCDSCNWKKEQAGNDDDDNKAESDYYDAKEVFDLTTIKSDWFKMSLHVGQLLPTHPYIPEVDNLLFGKVRAVNISVQDVEMAKKLVAMIQYYGGKTDAELSEATTHAIALDHMPDLKLPSNVKLVTPDWLIDSIKQNKLVDETEYDPKYLLSNKENVELLERVEIERKRIEEEKNKALDPAESMTKKDDEKKVDLNFVIIPQSMEPETPVKSSNKKEHDNIMYHHDEEQPSSQPDSASKKPKNFDLNMDEIFESVIASSATATSTSAVTSVSTTSALTDSTNKNNIPNLVSNATPPPPSRIIPLIEKRQPNELNPICFDLIKALNTTSSNSTELDFKFDEHLKGLNARGAAAQENAHLIEPESCLLGCVFHIGLNECMYAKECLDNWKSVIEQYAGKCVDTYDEHRDQITHVLTPIRSGEVYTKAIRDKKRVCSVYWLEDVLEEKRLRPPWQAYHFPSAYELNKGPLTNHILSSHGFEGKEKIILRTMIWMLNGRYTSALSNINSILISKNDPTSIKVNKAREWKQKIVNGCWLMELYLGNLHAMESDSVLVSDNTLSETAGTGRYTHLGVLNHFSYDPLLVSEFMSPWMELVKVPIQLIRQAAATRQSSSTKPVGADETHQKRFYRSVSPSDSIDPKKLKNDENRSEDQVKLNGLSWQKSTIPSVMFTGLTVGEVAQFQKDVVSLGGILAKQPVQATHLVVDDKLERTAKLLKCISTCSYILNKQWIIDSKSKGEFQDPLTPDSSSAGEYLYEAKSDSQFETRYQCVSLREALSRARQHKQANKHLFDGLTFYLSPSVRPNYADLKEMAELAGGSVVINFPTLAQLQQPLDSDDPKRQGGLGSRFVLISAESDLSMFKTFYDKNIAVYNEELIMCNLLNQKLDTKPYRYARFK